MANLTEKLEKYRLSESEYKMICKTLNREPQGIEWALFSALWSEHCSYKSSRIHLKKLFNNNKNVVVGFGENAGVIDLGRGERVAFKMESHNHPSFIEPYQGAATGVGGILRDVFTMGARPIALANYLCFGEPNANRMSSLVDGVTRGIGGYGNCVGVPTITGQTEFHKSYNENILVNALAVGLFEEGEEIFLSKAKGVGNLVVYVGAKTGRDGVHGASMASESFDEDSESKRPTVQIGDPFLEKLLIESCLEVMRKKLVVAIQDMGAAGIISSGFEMADKGGVGFELELDKVPIRDSSITPEEILLSESQERMLLVCEPENIEKLQKVFYHWGLDATVIGKVTEGKSVKITWHNETLTDIEPKILVDNAPQYDRPHEKWLAKYNEGTPNRNVDSKKEILANLSSIQGTSRNWIYEQYDQRVGGNTIGDCSKSIGMVRLQKTNRALGLVLGCRPYIMRFDASVGAMDAIFYPALQLAAKGFKPLAVTDCLNFGNPEKKHIMSEFVASTQNMSIACQSIDAPIISGNVSLYNETQTENITSTPSTGLIGLKEDIEHIPSDYFKKEGHSIYLLAEHMLEFGGLGQELKEDSITGQGELNAELASAFIEKTLHHSVQSISTNVVGKFGLAHSLAKMCNNNIGCKIKTDLDIFNERLYEVILVSDAIIPDAIKIGETITKNFIINEVEIKLEELNNAYNNWGEHFANH